LERVLDRNDLQEGAEVAVLLFLRKNRQAESCVGHFLEGTGAPEPSFRFSVMRGRQQICIAVA